jgi:ribonuclease Z
VSKRLLGLALAMGLLLVLPASAQAESLKVTICGSGGPLPIRDRAKTCVAVEAGGALYLVDVGPESAENLMLWRMPIASAKAVFLTHFHSDHIGDLGEFNLQSWVQGRPAPLALVGPPGVERVAKGFNEAYALDHVYRHAHHDHGEVRLPIAAGLLAPHAVALPAAADANGARTALAWKDGPLTVTAIEVRHDPVKPAYAYRFDYKGRSVVISGDTRKWPPLASAAKGADVLVHEAQNADMTKMMVGGLKMLGQPRMASIMTDTLSYHTTPVEAEEIAKAAGVKDLVLYHLTQAGLPFYTPQAFTKGMDAVGGPPWRLASDGLTIELPMDSDAVEFGKR